MRWSWNLLLAAALVVSAPTLGAAAEPEPPPADGAVDEEGFGDDADDGFGEDGDEDGFDGLDDDDETVEEARPWSLTGFIRSSWSLWVERFDANPFAKGRQSVDLRFSYVDDWFKLVVAGHAEYDFAYLVERDSYDDPTLDAFEWQVDTREAFVSLSFANIQLSLGRQIVAWGDGDAFSPLDVVNPRDNREPGLSDLDDMRLPSLATRLQVTAGALMIELMVVHESWFGYTQPARGPFSPFEKLLADDPLVATLLGDRGVLFEHAQERFHGDNQQFFARAVYKGAGIDLGFHVASVLDRQGVLVPPDDLTQFAQADPVVLAVDHPRVTVIGWSGSLPFNDVVFKWELVAELDKPLMVGSPPADFGLARTDLFHTMLSASYSGVTDLNIGLEFMQPVMLRDPELAPGQDLLLPVEAPALALRVMYTALNEKLNASAVATMFGWQAEVGFLARFELSYRFVDAVTLAAGFVTYHPGDEFGPFYGLDRHDRLFIKLRWDFTIFD